MQKTHGEKKFKPSKEGKFNFLGRNPRFAKNIPNRQFVLCLTLTYYLK